MTFTKTELESIRQMVAVMFSISLPQGVGGIAAARELIAVDDKCAAELAKPEPPPES